MLSRLSTLASISYDPVWKPVLEFEGLYEASSNGDVRSLPRNTTRGKVLKTHVGKVGYPTCTLYKNGKKSTGHVPEMVCGAFHGLKPSGLEVRHLDGDKLNNHDWNLTWGTRSENTLDQVRMGRHHEANKVKCPAGHRYTAETTYWHNGSRHCKLCRKARSAAYEKTRVRSRAK